MAFQLYSDDFEEGGQLPKAHVFNGMGHHGSNESPHLRWDGAPEGTRSFVMSVYDPDAPTGSGWWHWVVINIPSSVDGLPGGAGSGTAPLPEGAIQTRTDFGTAGYGGAAPPPGRTHRYIFTIHALKVDRLDLDEDTSGAYVGYMVHMNTLGKATLTVSYGG